MKNQQRKEIETVRERTIKLNLSDADCWRLSKKAASAGASISEVLENFIGDLVDGTYTNGSDERMYANTWFDRCGFAMFPEVTFVGFLIDECILSDALEIWESYQVSLDVLALLNKQIETGTMESCGVKHTWKDIVNSDGHKCYQSIDDWRKEVGDDIKDTEHDIRYYLKVLKPMYEEYKKLAGESKVGTLEEEFQKLSEWKQEKDKFIGSQEGEI